MFGLGGQGTGQERIIGRVAAAAIGRAEDNDLTIEKPRVRLGQKHIFNNVWSSSTANYCVRAGIQSIHRGQTEAGLSLGMTYWQVFRYVILMPTLRVVWPPLASQFIATMLGSSVVSAISAEELTYAGMMLESRTFRTFEIFFFLAIVYFLMARLFSFFFSLTGQKVFREAWGQL